MECPLLRIRNEPRKDSDELDEEEDDGIKGISSELKKHMKPFILPTDERLNLMEWLLDNVEEGIMECAEIAIHKSNPISSKFGKALTVDLIIAMR
jgi:hypothetical protein